MKMLSGTAFRPTPNPEAPFASLSLNIGRSWRLLTESRAHRSRSRIVLFKTARTWYSWQFRLTSRRSFSLEFASYLQFQRFERTEQAATFGRGDGDLFDRHRHGAQVEFQLTAWVRDDSGGTGTLRTDVHYRLPDQNHELRTIVQAVNTMADSRQKLEADLRREDRLRVMGRVVAGIAHEIRNPLNSIRLSARLLAKRLHGQAPATEIITLITGEIDRLDSLLKSLLVFGADEPEKMRRQPLQPVLERTLALVKPHAEEHGVMIRVAAPGECEALVDGNYLQQALMNLLLNAIDASGRNGEVGLSLDIRGRPCGNQC